MDRDFGLGADAAQTDAAQHLPDPDEVVEGLEPTRQLLPGRDFIDFYGRSWLVLHSYARRLVTDPFEAEEIVQDAFLKLFIAMPELENEGHALAFMRTTIRNLCIDRYRKHSRRPAQGPLGEEHHDIEADDGQIDPVVAAEDAVVIREALSKLKWEHREALIAWEIEGASTAEIAQRIGVDEKNVKHTLNRARGALRKLLVGSSVDPEVDLSIPEQMSIAAERARPVVARVGALALIFILAWQPISRLVGGLTNSPESRVPPLSARGPETTAKVPVAPAHSDGPTHTVHESESPTRPHGVLSPKPTSSKDSLIAAPPRLTFTSSHQVKALSAPRLSGVVASPATTALFNSALRWNYSTLTTQGVVVMRSELTWAKSGLTWEFSPFFEQDGQLWTVGTLTAPLVLKRDSHGNYDLRGDFRIDPTAVHLAAASEGSDVRPHHVNPRSYRVKLSVSSDFQRVLAQEVQAVL